MPTYQFEAEIGSDGTIRIPPDVPIGPGPVTITLESLATEQLNDKSENIAQRLARAARELGITDLPSDLAENHDHYAHSGPKGIDRQ
jgi:hypothetical protein